MQGNKNKIQHENTISPKLFITATEGILRRAMQSAFVTSQHFKFSNGRKAFEGLIDKLRKQNSSQRILRLKWNYTGNVAGPNADSNR